MDRRVFLRCIAAELVLVACGRSRTTRSASPVTNANALTSTTSPASPPSTSAMATPTTLPAVSFELRPDVSSEDQLAIREGIEIAQAYSTRDFGPLKAPVRVIAQNSTSGGNPSASATTSGNSIMVYTAAPGWFQKSSAVSHAKVLAHEYFHVLQYQIHFVPLSTLGPPWLYEGNAEYFARSAIIDQGLADEATVAVLVGFTGWRSVRQVPPLDQLESSQQWNATSNASTYGLATASVEVLVQDHGGVAALRSYYDRFIPGRAVDWRNAFTEAFGLAPAEFYTQIARLRA